MDRPAAEVKGIADFRLPIADLTTMASEKTFPIADCRFNDHGEREDISDCRFSIADLTTMASRQGKCRTIAQARDKTRPQRQQGSTIADCRLRNADCDKPEAQARVDVAGQIINSSAFGVAGAII